MASDPILEQVRLVAHPHRLGLRLRNRGRNLVGSCPFHSPVEDTLFFSSTLGYWQYRCLQCGAAGELLDFVVKTQFQGLERAKALTAAYEFWGVTKKDQETVLAKAIDGTPAWMKDGGSDKVRVLEAFARYCHWAVTKSAVASEYLSTRGWTISQAQLYGIGYFSGDADPFYDFCFMEGIDRHLVGVYLNYLEVFKEPRITFPARNSKGVIHTVYGRRMDEDAHNKYVAYASGPTDIPYNIHPGIEHPVLVKGLFDALTADMAGVTGVVSLMHHELTMSHIYKLKACGAESLTLVMSRRLDRRSLEQEVERSLRLADEAGMRFKSVLLPKGFDADTFIRQEGVETFLELLRKTEHDTSQTRRRTVLLQELKENYEDNMARTPGAPLGYRLEKFPRLMEFLDGVQPGYYLVSSHPFGGKTSLLLNLGMDLMESNPIKLIFLTLETPRKQLFNRMVAYMSGVEINEVQKRSEDEARNQLIQKVTMDLMGLVKANRLEVWDDNQVGDDRTLLRMLHDEWREQRNLVVCIDGIYHLQIVSREDIVDIDERRSAVMLDIYKELDIPVFCSGELSMRREMVEGGKAPGLVDITGPRAYVRDPAVVMFLSAAEKGLHLTLAKNRVGGKPISIALSSDSTIMRLQEKHLD